MTVPPRIPVTSAPTSVIRLNPTSIPGYLSIPLCSQSGIVSVIGGSAVAKQADCDNISAPFYSGTQCYRSIPCSPSVNCQGFDCMRCKLAEVNSSVCDRAGIPVPTEIPIPTFRVVLTPTPIVCNAPVASNLQKATVGYVDTRFGETGCVVNNGLLRGTSCVNYSVPLKFCECYIGASGVRTDPRCSGIYSEPIPPPPTP